jgi:RNA polymerase sigma factor for flagellar operon FliA
VYPSTRHDFGERRIEGQTREEICRKYQRKILLLARRISERLPSGCELGGEDLASFGAIGLLEAFDRYDDQRDILFTTFAEYRIRGAMMDALRATDTFTRHRRQLSKRIHNATTMLTHSIGRRPEPSEVAAHLDMDLDTYWRSMDRVLPVFHVQIDDRDSQDGESEGRAFSETISDDTYTDAFAGLIQEEARGALKAAVQALPERKRECVLLYYGRDMNLAEVAEVFSVTPSRVSQVLSEARKDLRRALDGHVEAGDLVYREAL